MKSLNAMCVALALISSSVLADDTLLITDRSELWDLPLEQLMLIPVSTVATGTPTPVSRSASSVSVISRADITAMGATDIDQVLESVPGLHITRSSQANYPRYIFRGVASTYNPEALLMINGIPQKTLFSGARSNVWGGMPVKAIERIEVIRGPGSALYGADAFAGVINIITRSGRDMEDNSVGVRAGSFDTWGAWTQQRVDFEEAVLGLVLEYEDSNGTREPIPSDAQTLLDSLIGTDASLSPGPMNLGRQATDLRVDLTAGPWQTRLGYQGRNNVGTFAGIASALDPSGLYRSERVNGDISFNQEQWQPDWDLQATLSVLHLTQESIRDNWLFPPGANAGTGVFPEGVIGNPSYWENQARGDLSLAYHGIKHHIVRVGSGYYWGDIYKVQESKNFDAYLNPLPGGLTDVSDTPDAFLQEGQRTSSYLFVQDEWRLADSTALTSGVRYDHYSDVGDTTNPRLALVQEWIPALSTRLSYGRAFHAPTFIDLYATNNPVGLGNPNLEPEVIDTWELSLHHQPRTNLGYSITGFSYRIDDAISYVNGTAANIGQRKGRGGELEGTWQALPVLRLVANYSYQKATDLQTEADVGQAPRDDAYLRLEWEFLADWHWNTEVLWVGKQARTVGDPRPPLQDYTQLNLTLSRQNLWRQLDLMLNLRNLADANVREPSDGPSAPFPAPFIPDDYPQPGRAVTAEALWHW
ncbi:MAG TPA: TonB-dependent receptor [Dongiaceae bacterium]|nr:TonB-dependent receptor [Dongiaceae bacterium]